MNDAGMVALIWIASVVASILSGIFGMAGGMVLMGVYSAMLSISTAMILHGITQFSSNGYRWLILMKFTHWRGLGWYFAGCTVATATFFSLSLVPEKAVVYLILGSLPFVAVAVSGKFRLDYSKPGNPFFAGALVNGIQLMAGAAGPALDIFFIDSKLTKNQVVATKSLTQTIAHAFKITYFSLLLSTATTSEQFEIPFWVCAGSVIATFIGTSIGNSILQKFSETQFRLYTRRIVMTIGGYYLIRGALLLAQN
jgi:uncharacterized membrane protein YfcA